MEGNVTINFKRLSDSGFAEGNASAILEDYKESGMAFFDRRNGIWCCMKEDDTGAIGLYKNYIDYVNSKYDSWERSSAALSYLDMGLVPVLWAPSFMADILARSVTELAESWQIELIFLPPSSLLQRGYVGGSKDTWVKRRDLAKILNCSEDKACLSELLKMIGG